MSAILKIIRRIWVRPFYERHAMFLLLVFYFMFGLIESSQLLSYHLSLIHASLNSPLFLALVFLLWALYLIKSVLFLEGCITEPQNLVLKQFGLLNKKKQFLLFCYTLFLTFEPVFVYSLFMIAIALQNQFVWSGISIIVFDFVIISISALRLVYVINSSSPPLLQLPSLSLGFIKPFPFFYIGLLLDRFKITLLLTKIFSVLCIIGFLQLPVDHYEPRIALLGLSFGLFAHSVIVFEWGRFEDQYLFFVKSLPITTSYRFVILMIAYAILLLPEWFVLLSQGFQLIDSIIGLMTGVAFLIFAHCLLYQGALDSERHYKNMFWLFIVSFFLILCKLALPASIVVLMVALGLMIHHIRKYESSSSL